MRPRVVARWLSLALMATGAWSIPGCSSDPESPVSTVSLPAEASSSPATELHPAGLPEEDTQREDEPTDPPPLVVEEDAPLLLDEPVAKSTSSSQTASEEHADNQPCFVCHVNYKDEPLAIRHARAEIGCVDCHGESYAHRNDENNTTPPDRMYVREGIDRACRKCHTTHDAPAVAVIARWLERCPDREDPTAVVCTDCHGEHRLKLRSVRWDKKSGKLIQGGRVR